MGKEPESSSQPRSYFAKRLAEDPVLAAKCEEIVVALRSEAAADIQAGIRSEQLGPNDYGIVINARADTIT